MDSGNCIPKIRTDAKRVNKDNAQAGIPAKRDFFIFLFMIVSFLYNFYLDLNLLWFFK